MVLLFSSKETKYLKISGTDAIKTISVLFEK